MSAPAARAASSPADNAAVRTVMAADTRFLVRESGAADGAGVPLLLLHGVPETSTCWRDVAPLLATGRRVLAPDLPGLGGSAYSGPYDVESLAGQLAALVEGELGGRVDVVGHDWGGVLALALAGARPDLVRRLGVVNAPYRSVALHRAVHVPFLALPVLPEALFRVAGRRVVETALRVLWRGAEPLPADVVAEYSATYSSPVVMRAMLAYYRAAARPVLRGLRPQSLVAHGKRRPVVGAPVAAESVLVLWGADDAVLPISVGESVVRDLGPDTVMITVPGAGHFVVEEQPQVVAEVLTQFLADDPKPPFVPPATRAAREA